MQIGLEMTTANAGGDIATSITSANTNGIHATRDFIGCVVLFRPRHRLEQPPDPPTGTESATRGHRPLRRPDWLKGRPPTVFVGDARVLGDYQEVRRIVPDSISGHG